MTKTISATFNTLTFDPRALPAAPVQLIEASAGTGKTYSITSLYLRFILEQELPVEKILVLSFTEAATAELHERLRSRLQSALAAFHREGAVSDPFLAALVAASRDPSRDRLLLQKALAEIDQAAVTTIHSFCQRVLQEGAFESGLPFELELVDEIAPLLDEIIHDYLAAVFHREDPRLLALLQRRYRMSHWRQMAAVGVRHRYFPLVNRTAPRPGTAAPVAGGELTALTASVLAAFARAQRCWREQRAAIVETLEQAEFRAGVSRQLAGGLLDRLADALATSEPNSFAAPAGSEHLTPEKFSDPEAKVCPKSAINKGRLPQHPFFEHWRDYLAALALLDDHYRLRTISGLIEFARHQLPARLFAARTQSFDDLLYRLEQSLRGEGREALAALIAARYPVVLIDEFQDTDPVQYAIFQAVYGGGADPLRSGPPSRLILIGDPKQAIYGFRGADIFAYLRAAHDSGRQRYTMTVNWRADHGMVAAINAMFGGVAAPFAIPEIDFPRVEPRPEAGDCWRGGRHGGSSPLQFLTLPPELAGQVAGPRSKRPLSGKLERLLPDLVAADLVALLQGGAMITAPAGAVLLRPPDIAVLVRSNRQAEAMQAALRKRGVKAVIYSRASVFQSREAGQLAILLHGLLEQAGEEQRRAAMLTELLAVTPRELIALEQDEEGWQRWLDDFERWRLLWRERGFMAMVRAIGDEKRLAARLLTAADGERRLTNYRHLFELLHRQERQSHLRATALLKWLNESMTGERHSGEADELRLESDEEAVRVLTVHRSKGLEFPVVYCPYLWKSGRRRTDEREELFTYHDPVDNRAGKIALLPDQEQRQQRRQEQFAEELRLLYVALTRARHCCLVPWEAAADYEHSALAYLLHGADQGGVAGLAGMERDEILARLIKRVKGEKTWELRLLPEPQRVGNWRGAAEGAAEPGCCRLLPEGIAHAWRVGSFSQLVAGRASETEDFSAGRDYDAASDPEGSGALVEAGPATAPGPAESDRAPLMAAAVPLAGFPAGLAAGNLLHRIFELISFSDDRRHREIIAAQMAAFGLDGREERTETLRQAVTAVLQTPLLDTEPFRLADIDDRRRLNEMPFIFPVRQQGRPLEPDRLAAAFAAQADWLPPGYPEQLRRLHFSALQGYLKGFIDLIFRWRKRWYIVDYKSNLLGPLHADYRPARLHSPMAGHHYILQYHIYTVALHRHLAARMPGYDYRSHFGGVFYLFIRGMHPRLGPAAGIFHDRPAAALIENLSREIFADRPIEQSG